MQEQDIEHAETEPIIVPGSGDPDRNREEEYMVVDDEGGNAFLVPPDDTKVVTERGNSEGRPTL